MEDIDDDFGDLYADVEPQVNSAISGVPDFTESYSEQVDNSTKKSNPKQCFISDLKNIDSIGDYDKTSALEVNGNVEEIVDNGSDSEDDLNIVLNDEDCPIFPVTGGASARNEGDDVDEDDDFIVDGGNGSGKNRSDGLELSSAGNGAERGNGLKGGYHSQFSQYKYIRSHAATFPSNAKGNGSFSSTIARGDRSDNEWNQYRSSTSGQVGPIDATALQAIAQSGCGFLLPRYRTILDINIDAFEQKPWRHPGLDITDFFNFGFDEQSWKDYCNSVEQFRRQTSMPTRIPVYESSKYNQAFEAGSEHEKVPQEAVAEETAQSGQRRTDSHASKIAASGVWQLEVPKGRAIQVEDSIGERQPSMDVRRPRIRDTNVVIQITVQDSTEDSSGSGMEELAHKDSALLEASENVDFGVNGNIDIHFRGSITSISGDELSAESLDGSVGRVDRPSALKRCSQPTSPSNPIPVDSDNHGIGQNSDVDRPHHEKLDVHTSEGNSEVMETQSKTEEGIGRNSFNADPCVMEMESSLGERVHHSLSSSSFGSHSEAYEDDVYIDPEKVQKPVRRMSLNLDTELWESDASDYSFSKDSKSNGIKMKPGCKHSVRNQNPFLERRVRCSRRLHGVARSKVHTCDNDVASPMSDAKILYDKDYSSVGRRRRNDRLHDFGSYDREDISYYRETELCFNYDDERAPDNHFETTCTKNSHRKGRHGSRDEIEPYLKRKWDEREFLFEQKIMRVDNEILKRDWCHQERGLTVKDADSRTYRESRQLVSKYSSYSDKEDTRWRRSEKHYFQKRTDNGDPLVESEHAYDFMREKYGRAVPSIDRQRDSLNGKCEKRLQFAGREGKNYGRRERYGESPTLDMDYTWPTGIEDDYKRHVDHKFLSSQSYRGHRSGNGVRMHESMSPRDDLSDLQLTERYGRRRTQIYADRCRDGDWFGGYTNAYDTENSINYPDGHVHFGRRKYNWQSRELHWTEDELISRPRDDEWYDERASFSYERISRHERIHAKHGSAQGRILIDDKQVKQHRYKMIREGSSGSFINRSSNVIHRVKHEQAILRCKDSVDVVVGGGKVKLGKLRLKPCIAVLSSGRCTKATCKMCNGRPESLNSKIDKEQTTYEDFNQSHSLKAVQPDITKIGGNLNQGNEKRPCKFPVTEHNEVLDLEEGQILTHEPEKGVPMEKKHVSESSALTSDRKKITLQKENAANRNKVVGGYDNHRILETLAKMEKRGERFKDPLTLKKEALTLIKEPVKNPYTQVDPIVETEGTKPPRPARKRRWGGN